MSGNQTGGTMTGTSPTGSGTGGSVIQHKPKSRAPAIIGGVVILVVIAVLLGGYYGEGWFKPASSSSCGVTTKGTLLGEGSTLVAPLMDQWATSYWSGGVLTYDSVGSSSGIASITSKTSDYGASDAPLTASQQAAAPGLLTIPESAGGVVPIYNLPSLGQLNFNGSILAQIYDGAITNWNNTPLQ